MKTGRRPRGNPNWKKGQHPGTGRQWVKGEQGVNPADRGAIVRMIRTATENGEELVDFHLAVFRGTVPEKLIQENGQALIGKNGEQRIRLKSVPLRERLIAADWLATRGWGKAPQPLKSYDEGTSIVTRQMLRTLSNEDLKILKAIAVKAHEALERQRVAIGTGDGRSIGGDGNAPE